MKVVIRRVIFSILIISTFALSLSFMKPEIKEEELLAYVDISDTTVEVRETTSEVTTSEVTTSETTTTTSVATTAVTTTSTKKSITPGIGEIKGNVDSYYLSLLNKELNKLPSNVLNKFVNSGWHIYVTSENIAKTVFGGQYSSVQGVTIYKEKTILISAKESCIRESTIHEFGHFIDYTYNFSSDSVAFKNIYKEEVDLFKSRITNSSCVRDEQEFFAETLYYMYKNPSKCTEKAYEFVNKKLNNM